MNNKEITSTCAIVFDENNNILVIKNHRGWDIPGGKVEPGENPDDAVVREVFEEASVTVGNVNLFHKQEFLLLGWKIAYYRCDIVKIHPFKMEFETTHREFMSIQDFLEAYGGEDLKETEEIIKMALKL